MLGNILDDDITLKKDIFATLNKEQLESTRAPFGNNLILAGAGTGKTSTIVGRVIYLIKEQGVSPKEIILLTFTSKASKEMKERLSQYIDDSIVSQMSISTYHALSLQVVKKYFPDKKLITEKQARFLLQSTYSRVVKFEQEGFLKPSSIFSYIDNYLNSLSKHTFGEWLNQELDFDNEGFVRQYSLVFDAYVEDKETNNILSFTDLLIYAKKHFLAHENTIKEMIVDEYQDTNYLQNSILETIKPESLFCVGDYDQSIYSFNGSDLSIIEDFGNKENFNLFNLSKNYRSSEPILNLAEKVIANNPRLYPKKLEVMKKDINIMPECFTYDTAFNQYLGISSFVKTVLASKKDDETIAVLYRSNSSGDGIELALKSSEVPFIRSEKNDFLEQDEIQVILNVFRLSLYKTLDFLDFSITIKYLVNQDNLSIIESYFNLLTQNNTSLDKALEQDKGKTTNNKSEFISSSMGDIQSFIKLLDFKSNSTEKIIEKIIESDYFASYVSSFARHKGGNDGAFIEKYSKGCYAKAKALLKIAQRQPSPKKFLKDMLKPQADKDADGNDFASLLTVHASKGLEFTYVYVVDMDDESFPNKKLMKDRLDDDEERRLFYVAVTRAIKKIVFSYYQNRKKGKKQNKPSRFLIEGNLL